MGTIIPQAVIDRMVKLLETIFQEPTNEIPLLKGHLLIEEMLDKIISKNAHNPQYIEKAKLSFYNKIFLARAFTNLEEDEWFWKSIEVLNEARNSLGHKLDKKVLEEKINNFIILVEPIKNFPSDLVTKKFTKLRWAITYVYINLSKYADFNLADLPPKSTLLTENIKDKDK